MRTLGLTLLLVLCCPRPSFAETTSRRAPRIAVLPAAFSESVSVPIRERVLQRFYQALAEHPVEIIDHETVAGAFGARSAAGDPGCRSGACVRWVLESVDADAALRFTVNAVESSYSIAIVVLGPGGNEIARTVGRCDICTFDELAETVGRIGGEISLSPPRLVRTGHLEVSTIPENALVRVDGVEVGQGTLVVPLVPGRHVIEALHDGFATERQEVELEAGGSARVELELQRPAASEPEPRRRSRYTTFLRASFAVGLILGVTGAVFLGIEPMCLDEDGSGGCTRAWEEQSAFGAGLVGGGAAMAIVSAITLTLLDGWSRRTNCEER